jgi:hypothetical protein
MGSFGTSTNPAHYVEVPDTLNSGQTKRPPAGTVLKARNYSTAAALPDITTTDFGYWSATFSGVDLIDVSGDGGSTWIGPLVSVEAMRAAATAGQDATSALAQAAAAVATAQQALLTAQNGPAATWDNISGKPATFPPSGHTHTTGQVGATPVGKALLDAADAQAARVAIGAGTGNGTSNLTLGTTAGTAAAGNHTHQASGIGFTPAGGITATDVQAALVQAAAMGGGGGSGGGAVLPVLYASGAYPAQAASAPAGISVRLFLGPTQYVGPTWAGVVDVYHYAALS